ncbi:unnamed protein product [Sordaria macrospora k-hell]|uniref:WGS project CABT00000000 data, contig 2.63 n=1 Tax=Sordaria macrospora (strain ATCC MYA-333 / DSM 997 / K(L3346) / K-hell) TaxID=771870 RepID=F7WAN6_SORMK|nr:uncharacterized protein SMAC_08689 [Sordaria macrospora k-hell]CCC14231.1 unnamed protein product [Sordaria macrospora k-hell]
MAPLPLPHIPASTIDKFENIIFKRVVYPALQGVEAIHPTRTLSPITRRQDAPPAATVTVVQAADDDDDDPTDASTLSGGAIAGIVIGSIAGLLLLIWIIRSCSNLGAPPTDDKPNGKAWYHGVRDEYPPRHVGGVRLRIAVAAVILGIGAIREGRRCARCRLWWPSRSTCMTIGGGGALGGVEAGVCRGIKGNEMKWECMGG